MIDYSSVLLAVGVSAMTMFFTLFANWLKQRDVAFLLSFAIMMVCVLASVSMFFAYNITAEPLWALAAGIVLIISYVIAYGASMQVATGTMPRRTIGLLTLWSVLGVLVPLISGFETLGAVMINLIPAALSIATAHRFWRIRAESPGAITMIALLQGTLAVSYVLCAGVIAFNETFSLSSPPQTWAQHLNLMVAVVSVTGIGGLLVTLHQERIARAYKRAAITDALTGVLNRRALNDRFADGHVPANNAFVVFDLDDFKGVNDRHGHSQGDHVLRVFARLMQDAIAEAGVCARLGGEEFAAILPGAGGVQAKALAEMVRLRFAQQRFSSGSTQIACTVSAGVGTSGPHGCSLDQLMQRADEALYVSKRGGRNRVTHQARVSA